MDIYHSAGNIRLYPLERSRTLVFLPSRPRIEVEADIDLVERALRDDPDLTDDVRDAFADLRHAVGDIIGTESPSEARALAVEGDGELMELVVAHLPGANRAGDSMRRPALSLVVMDRDRDPRSDPEWKEPRAKRWLPVVVRDGALEFGPRSGIGAECTYADLLDRRLAAALSAEHELAFRTEGRALGEWNASVVEALRAAHRVLGECGAQLEALDHAVLSIDLQSRGHHVRPLHALPSATTARPSRDVESLVDRHHGLISRTRRITHHESAPSRLVTVQADVGLINRITPWANNSNCQGSVFDDYESARQGAIGESVERYCANLLETLPRVRASWSQLHRSGQNALDPLRLVLHSDEQYAHPTFPLVRFTRDLVTSWVPGRSITTGEPIWVPASMVYVNYYAGPYAGEPATNLPSYPGIAAGPNEDFAIVSGIEEIIERHATMVWWHNAIQLPKLELPPEVTAVWDEDQCRDQRWWAFRLPNEFDVPVVAAVVENSRDQLINIGFAARPRLNDAVLKAWSEALTLQEGSRDLLQPDGAFRQAYASGLLNGSAIKAHRPDRHYMDSYRDDFRDMNDLMCQQQFYLDPRARQRIAHIIDTERTERRWTDLDLPDRSLSTYRRRVETRGYEIISVDVTSLDVAATGMRVVRVLIPGLVPNFPAGFPHLGHARLQTAAVDMGLRATPLAAADLNRLPLPHA